MSRAGHAFEALLLGAVLLAGPARAAKLDKETCAALAGELAGLSDAGIKADMERGPAWCLANLSAERLQSMRRVLELEDQIEFRCGGRSAGKPKEAPSAPSTPATRAVDTRTAGHQPAAGPAPGPAAGPVDGDGEDDPAPVVKAGTAAANAPSAAKPQPDGTAPAAALPPPVAQSPAPTLPAAATVPPGAAASTSSVRGAAGSVTETKALPAAAPPVVDRDRPKPVVAANPPPAPASAPAAAAPAAPPTTAVALPGPPAAAPPVAPAAGPAAPAAAGRKPGDPAQAAARKKNQRRNSSSAYVSPGEVSPYSLPGLR